MKKLLFLIGLPILLAGCQDDALLKTDGTANGDGNVTFQISTDDMLASRSDAVRNSAAGGITNIDMTEYDLRYQLAIYRYDGSTLTEVISPQLRTVSTYAPVTYNVNLTAGKKYKAVVWADFVREGSEYDLHYDTSNLYAVTPLEYDDTRLNDESRDAYAISQDFEVADEPFSVDLTLKRMLAKLRIVTTDWDLPGVEKPDAVSITYTSGFVCTSVDVVNNDDAGYNEKNVSSHPTYEAEVPETKYYKLNYDAADNNCTILVDYILRSGTYNSYLNFTLKTYKDGAELTSIDVDTDVPSRANWLTTVLGNLLSAGTELTIECDEMFINEYNYSDGSDEEFTPTEPDSKNNVYYVTNADELAWISENVASLSGATVELKADIDLQNKNWTPINTNGNISKFDGNGYTISNLYINRKEEFNGLFGKASDIEIRKVKVNNVTIVQTQGFNGGLVGALGIQGGNNRISECVVSNFFARTYRYDKDNMYSQDVYMTGFYNTGGLVGQLNCGELYESHVLNFDIECAWRAGGLVGFVNLPGYNTKEVQIRGCLALNGTVWNATIVEGQYASTQMRQAGAFVGTAFGEGESSSTLLIEDCAFLNVTYKYSGWWTNDETTWERVFTIPGVLSSNDEPWNNTYIFDYNGTTYTYGPMNKYVGWVDNITIDIENEEDLSEE